MLPRKNTSSFVSSAMHVRRVSVYWFVSWGSWCWEDPFCTRICQLGRTFFVLSRRAVYTGRTSPSRRPVSHKPFARPGSPTYTEVLPCRTVYYSAPVAATAPRIEREVMALSASLAYLVEAAEHASRGKDDILMAYRLPKRTELVIVDEADRLKMAGLEQLRDLYDKGNFG